MARNARSSGVEHRDGDWAELAPALDLGIELARLGLDQAAADRVARQLDAIAHPELREDVGAVTVDRLLCDLDPNEQVVAVVGCAIASVAAVRGSVTIVPSRRELSAHPPSPRRSPE